MDNYLKTETVDDKIKRWRDRKHVAGNKFDIKQILHHQKVS